MIIHFPTNLNKIEQSCLDCAQAVKDNFHSIKPHQKTVSLDTAVKIFINMMQSQHGYSVYNREVALIMLNAIYKTTSPSKAFRMSRINCKNAYTRILTQGA